MEVVETLKVHSNYMTVYDTFVDAPPRVTSESTHAVNFVDNFHDMKMSAGAVKTVKKAVNLILYLSRKRHYAEIRRNSGVSCLSYRNNDVHNKAVKAAKNAYLCTFVTLTLPAQQQHTDKEITKYCLNPFMSYARKYFKVRYFVWKKELQGNGNLHFHLVTDRFIDHKCLRRTWNRIINSGKVDGCKTQFDYVDRYNQNMREFYAHGFNRADVLSHIKQLDHVKETLKDKVESFETKQQREITAVEYDKIANALYDKELTKWQNAYDAEMKLPETERWHNPNSTDIDAVKSPAGVSLYVAKYIAKDISDNPALIQYTTYTEDTKQTIYALMRTIDDKERNGEDTAEERKQLEFFKNALSEYRKTNCPIQGHLWFKSKTLTPFLNGASDFITTDIANDLTALIDEIKQEEQRRKTRLIICSYEKDEHGNNTDKCLCTTLLFNVFDFMLSRAGNTNNFKYPALRAMWQRFIADCIIFNRKRGLYEF